MGVRGYTAYRPRAETRYWLERAQQVINDYRQYWPLTVRQVFYRMVAEHAYDKTEAAYGRLASMIARARRAYLIDRSLGIPFEAIRDDSMRFEVAHFYRDEDHFVEVILGEADSFRIDRQVNQEQVIEMWCEAAGMVPILTEIADPYCIRVSSGGGYDSVTSKHLLADRAVARAERGIRTVVLHVGDFDGSGENMADVMEEDVLTMASQRIYSRKDRPRFDHDDDRIAWATSFFALERVALTEQQVIDYNVVTAPTKPSDSRSNGFVGAHPNLVAHLGTREISAQLEALTPPDLQALLTRAIEDHIDDDVYRDALVVEAGIRDSIKERLESW